MRSERRAAGPAVPLERLRLDGRGLALHVDHAARRDPAALEHAQRVGRVSGAKQANPRIDAEHMEVVVRHSAVRDRGRQQLPGAARAPPETLVEVGAQRARVHSLEQRAPDPVGLDYTGVERVVDPIRARDQLQVGPRALEAPGELTSPPSEAPASPYSSSVRFSSAPQ